MVSQDLDIILANASSPFKVRTTQYPFVNGQIDCAIEEQLEQYILPSACERAQRLSVLLAALKTACKWVAWDESQGVGICSFREAAIFVLGS